MSVGFIKFNYAVYAVFAAARDLLSRDTHELFIGSRTARNVIFFYFFYRLVNPSISMSDDYSVARRHRAS